MTRCNCKFDCVGIGLIASILLGVVAAFLRYSAVITVTPAFLWVLFGVGIGILVLSLFFAVRVRSNTVRECTCEILPSVLTGVLGTILTSVILLGITFVATSVLGAVITGAAIFFFALTITSWSCLVSCAAGCADNE